MKWLFVVAAFLGSMVSGCARVKPYQREYLSARPMDPAAEAGEDRFRQHWQESREGSFGGTGAAGGGCGCN